MDDKIELITGVNPAELPAVKPAERADNIGQFIGEAMSDDQKINALMSSSKPEITVLVGFVGYGKTSFVSSFYQTLLQKEDIAGYAFYDSETLVGLERRSFLRRLNNRNIEIAPETKRTVLGEPYLLTFHLSHPQYGDKLVVISDHSGEDYADYAAKKGKIADDILIKNADRIMFFVDSEKLCNEQRLSLTTQYQQLLRNMKENGLFVRKTKLQLVFNKIDKVNDENKFGKEKDKLITNFEDIINLKIGQTFEIRANSLNNNNKLISLFEDIILHTVEETSNQPQASSLDWVNEMINKKK